MVEEKFKIETWGHHGPIRIRRVVDQIVVSVEIEDGITLDVDLSDREAHILGEALVDVALENGYPENGK